MELWNGFVFVRLEGGGPGVAEMMRPHEEEVAPYRLAEMRALGRITLRPRAVNWKNVADNYSVARLPALLPRAEHLPERLQRRWLYFKLWPNVAIDLYPDQVDFMHFVPVGPTETLIREVSYALPDTRREMRAARYLNWRINRRVNAEDTALIARVQQGMASRAYMPGPLGESEVCLRGFAGRLRRLIPEALLERAPPPGWSRAGA